VALSGMSSGRLAFLLKCYGGREFVGGRDKKPFLNTTIFKLQIF